MKAHRILGVVVATSLGGVTQANAASDFFTSIYCNSGQALKTCAEFQFTTASNGSGGTLVMLLVRNLAGQHPLDNSGPNFISKIGLANVVGTYVGGSLSVGTSGNVNVVGNPGPLWVVGTAANELGSLLWLAETGSPAKNGGIQGCGLSSAPTAYFQTCAPTYDGWVQFSFQTNSRWYASDALVAYKVQGAGVNGISLECITNPNDAKFNCSPPETPVPEPATMGLLATGLLALSGAGWVRRRRKQV